jgi:hypothetical protein
LISEIVEKKVEETVLQRYPYTYNEIWPGYYQELQWAGRYFFSRKRSWSISEDTYENGYIGEGKVIFFADGVQAKKYTVDYGDAIAWYEIEKSTFSIGAASRDMDRTQEIIDLAKTQYPEYKEEGTTRKVQFWSAGADGASAITRHLEMTEFKSVKGNYPTTVNRQLKTLFDRKKEPRGGQIVL